MKSQDAKTFEALLADYVDADHEAHRANARKAQAHINIISWVSARVPAGTSEPDVLDIPEFLRRKDLACNRDG